MRQLDVLLFQYVKPNTFHWTGRKYLRISALPTGAFRGLAAYRVGLNTEPN